LSSRIPAVKTQALIGLSVFALAMLLAWQIGSVINGKDERALIFAAVGLAGFFVIVTILRNWRTGFYLFLVWMLFEDLFRKYMGNGAALFFGKDILTALVYISLFAEIRLGREKRFRPPFLLFLSFFLPAGSCTSL
jgi:hypothetical protein